jgi:hypothetical protein
MKVAVDLTAEDGSIDLDEEEDDEGDVEEEEEEEGEGAERGTERDGALGSKRARQNTLQIPRAHNTHLPCVPLDAPVLQKAQKTRKTTSRRPASRGTGPRCCGWRCS